MEKQTAAPAGNSGSALAQLLARLDRQQLAPDELVLILNYRLLSKRDQAIVRTLIKALEKEE